MSSAFASLIKQQEVFEMFLCTEKYTTECVSYTNTEILELDYRAKVKLL